MKKKTSYEYLLLKLDEVYDQIAECYKYLIPGGRACKVHFFEHNTVWN